MKLSRLFRAGLLATPLVVISSVRLTFPFAVSELAALAQTQEDRRVQAIHLNEEGLKLFDQNRSQEALNKFEQALAIFRDLGERQGEVTSLNGLGKTYLYLGENQKAIEFLQQSLAIAKEISDRSGEAQAILNLGVTYYSLGQYQKAIEFFQLSLNLAREIGDRRIENLSLINLGGSYCFLGQYQRAIEFFQQSLIVARETGNRRLEAASLSDLGYDYLFLGQYQKAIEFYQQSITIAREIGDRRWESYSLGYLGMAYDALEEYQKAIEFHQQQLTIAREISERRSEVVALNSLGETYHHLGQYQKAIEFHQQSLALAEQIGERRVEGNSLNSLGDVYSSLREYQRAIEFHQKSLTIAREIGDSRGEGYSLSNLGAVFFKLDQVEKAENQIFQSIKIWENIRSELGNNDINKISIFEQQANTYRLLQKVLIAQNKYNEALEISDRARARAFVELLAQRFTNSDDAQVTPLTLEQIQRIAKEQNATLVEYSLVYDDFNVNGKQQPQESELYIWVIQPTGEITFRRTDLKPLWQQQNTSLDKIVGEARCFENDACRQTLISSRGVGNIPEIRSSLDVQFNNAPGQSVAAAQGQQQNRQLQQLHQLLIAPIADILPKDPNNRVIFIPQSSLFLAPFPSLQDEKGNYLIEKHTILTAPSIQVLDLTHQQRQKLSPSIKDALVVGNPTMPTIPQEFGKPPQKLSPLLGAETEAKEIAQLLNTTPLMGNQATESVVVQKMLQSRIIHLATHGSFDPERGIGSWIALAPDSSTSPTSPPATSSLTPPTPLAKGGVQEGESVLGTTGKVNGDGFLKAEEIVDLKLNAELVALSACDTAQGKITGDGVVGLSRSIISAGVPSVLVSLWKVDDQVTAFLMREFYQNWQKSGDKAQALRQAMLTTKQKYSDPRYWAAFTLIGEAE